MLYPKQWQYLKKTYELQKMPHALLFYGQHSIGKKALALELIKLLNCQYGNTAERPCQTCRACLDIGKNVYPDLLIVEPEEDKEIKISQVRALHDHLALRAYASSFKAVMIDRAHLLNQEAQIAFLKLLEEPKGRTIFILLTQYPEMLLPTILSRVERLRFYSTGTKFQVNEHQKQMIAELLKISKQELVLRFAYAKKLTETLLDVLVKSKQKQELAYKEADLWQEKEGN